MKILEIKLIVALAAIVFVGGLGSASAQKDLAGDFFGTPELPPVCAGIMAPPGNKLMFRTYALGVQIYRWNGSAWTFVAPDARLYAAHNYRGLVGTHYAGPTWEGRDGSKVVAAGAANCTPNPDAIPWLLLTAVSHDGHGPFSRVSYIQRLNTIGGRAPSAPGTEVNEEARVPYSAEYYYYRSEN